MPGARKGSGEGAPPKPEGGSFSEAPSPPPSGADVEAPATQREEGSEELEALQQERDEFLSLAQRTKADFENYRKRVGREAAEAEVRGRADLARSLLPVLDNLERALAAAEPIDRDTAPNHLVHGVKLVYEELAGVLRGAGIETYSPAGEAFDPDWHEAMMTRAGEEGQVLEVLEKGYRLNGQVLRPARVVVGAEQRPPAGKSEGGSRAG
jgi:molecular chaperone GrpE